MVFSEKNYVLCSRLLIVLAYRFNGRSLRYLCAFNLVRVDQPNMGLRDRAMLSVVKVN